MFCAFFGDPPKKVSRNWKIYSTVDTDMLYKNFATQNYYEIVPVEFKSLKCYLNPLERDFWVWLNFCEGVMKMSKLTTESTPRGLVPLTL